MRRHLRDRLGAAVVDHDVAVRRIVGIGPHQRLELGLQSRLLGRIQRRVGDAEFLARAQFQHRLGLAVQPVRGPVRRDQRTMAPDGPQLLAADALPYPATLLDVGAGVEHITALGDHALRDGRRLHVDVPAHPQQYAETGEH